MCLILANLSYKKDLIPSEKHILLILCLRANPKKHTCFTSIERLIVDSGYSRRTIEKNLKSLRDKNLIIYTGVMKGTKKNIPEYKMTLSNHGNDCRDLLLITATNLDTTATIAVQSAGYHGNGCRTEREDLKDNKKEELLKILNDPKTSQPKKQMALDYLKNPEKDITKSDFNELFIIE